MLADLEDIKTAIERALPPEVVDVMREEGIALALVPQVTLQPLVDISDELAERKLLGDMVKLPQECHWRRQRHLHFSKRLCAACGTDQSSY